MFQILALQNGTIAERILQLQNPEQCKSRLKAHAQYYTIIEFPGLQNLTLELIGVTIEEEK